MADPAECWVENEIRYLQVLEYNAHAETRKVILETHFQLEAYVFLNTSSLAAKKNSPVFQVYF